MISSNLLAAIRSQYRLAWRGTHGAIHWARVLENGLRLAELTGANVEVVKLFAVLHDACRLNEGQDQDHGRRGADFAARLRGKFFVLGDADFELLYDACSRHTDGLVEGDITVQTCWDADRLDLGRVGIRPEPDYLCTPAAKDQGVIEWAHDRAERGVILGFALELWGVEQPHLKPRKP
jgi:uncharacterized protein